MEVVKGTLKAEMEIALRIVDNACDLVEALQNVWNASERGVVKSSTINAIFKEWQRDDPSWKDMPEIERRTIVAAAHKLIEREWRVLCEVEFRSQRIGGVLASYAKGRARRRRAAVIKKYIKSPLRIVK